MSAKPTLFLSYARADDEPFVARLRDDLARHGFDVWFDRVSLPSRQLTFHQEIKDAIRGRDRVVYVAGPAAAGSPYVREEWQFALELDKPVVPILRKGDCSHVPPDLGLFHCEDFRADDAYPARLAKLVADLDLPDPPLGRLFGEPALPPNFQGRPELARGVADALLADLRGPVVAVGGGARVGVHGMAGVGKSVLAAALARDRRVRRAYPDGVVWASVGRRPNLAQIQRDVARHLGLSGEPFENEVQGADVLRRHLLDKAVLLVLDNVWEAGHVAALGEFGPRCRTLITTRNAGALRALAARALPVPVLAEPEALALLAAAAGLDPAAVPAEAREVARECGSLPLALALSGGMARKRRGDFRSVLERLRRADLRRIADREHVNEEHRSVWRAMEAGVEVLPGDERDRFAELCVFATDRAVPEAAVAALWSHSGDLDALDTEGLLVDLAERSLIQLDQRAGPDGAARRSVRLHDLLHDFASGVAGDPPAVHRKLLDGYAKRCPGGWHTGPDDGYFRQRLTGHLLAAGRAAEAVDLSLDYDWAQAAVDAGLAIELLEANEAVVRVGVDHPAAWLIPLLSKALRRDVSTLAASPHLLMQCAWHTCYWHDADHGAAGPDAVPDAAADGTATGQVPGSLASLMRSWLAASRRRPRFRDWIRSTRPGRHPLASPLLGTLRQHTGHVRGIALVPGTDLLASCSGDKTVMLWDYRNYAFVGVLGACRGAVNAVACLPDGRVIVGCEDGSIRLWHVDRGPLPHAIVQHAEAVRSVAVTPDGRRILIGSESGTIRVWDATTFRKVAEVRAGARVNSLAVTADGHVLASDDRRILSLTPATYEPRPSPGGFYGHQGPVRSVAANAAGSLYASGSYDRTVKLWSAATGTCLATLRGHEWGVRRVVMSRAGDRVVSVSADRSVRTWDVRDRRLISCFHGHAQRVNDVILADEDSRVITASDDASIRIWDAAARGDAAPSRDHDGRVTRAVVAADGRWAASGSDDKTVRVWDSDAGRAVAVLGHPSPVLSVAIRADGGRVAAGCADGVLRVWDAELGDGPPESPGRAVGPGRYKLSPDVLPTHRPISAVCFNPDGTVIACGSWDNHIRLWDGLAPREHLSFPSGHKWDLNCIAVSADGRQIVSGGGDKRVVLYRSAAAWKPAVLGEHEHRLTDVRITRDGRYALSWDLARNAMVWNLDSGRRLSRLPDDCEELAERLLHDRLWPGSYVAASESGTHAILLDERRVVTGVVERGPEIPAAPATPDRPPGTVDGRPAAAGRATRRRERPTWGADVAARYPAGTKIEGTVRTLQDYGAFVEIEAGVVGLLHVSEMVWGRTVACPGRLLVEGQRVTCAVLSIDPTTRRIALGLKQLTDDVWATDVPSRYRPGDVVEGSVQKTANYGALVQLEAGVVGLLHAKQMTWGRTASRSDRQLVEGQRVTCVVLSVDPTKRRIDLGQRQLAADPWTTDARAKYRPGDVVTGRVGQVCKFGAFVDLEAGIQGLLHVSEMSNPPGGAPPAVGAMVEVRVLRVDPAGRKIGLTQRPAGTTSPAGMTNADGTAAAAGS